MPRADLLDKLARTGGVSVEWLLHGSGSGSKQAVRRQLRTKAVLPQTLLDREKSSERFVLPDFAPSGLRRLPRRYLERYQKRAAVLLTHLHRELEEYRRALETEFRKQQLGAKRRKRQGGRK